MPPRRAIAGARQCFKSGAVGQSPTRHATPPRFRTARELKLQGRCLRHICGSWCRMVHTTCRLLPAIGGLLALSSAGNALGVPSFARQTGLECTSCHLSWPELTSVGPQFKLGGYTLIKETTGERPL